jgi:hypothetical protein
MSIRPMEALGGLKARSIDPQAEATREARLCPPNGQGVEIGPISRS